MKQGSDGTHTRACSRALRAALPLFLLLGGIAPARALFSGFSPRELDRAAGGAATASEAGEREAPAVRALALRDGATLRIDGRLDDAAWQQAPAAGAFRQWDPDRGAGASEETVFKVAYDDDALYFAVACLEQDPARIAQRLSRRDQFTQSDILSIYLDPYFDRTTGYNFRVNPLGVQEDSYVYNDGDQDGDWDAVWQAETSQDADGWYAEVRIPFSAIRYRTDAPAWGLQLYRYMHGRGEETAWTVWDRETAGFVSRFGRLEGLQGIRSPRQLEVLPYAMARATDLATTGPETIDRFENFGLDLKYGATADLTLNATFQPDFGQVEADPATLNLSPHETYFEEKRPFFIEGSRFFEHPGFNLFHSRRIGEGSENTRIRYAAKLTGKTAGGVSLAALLAGTDVAAEGQAHNPLKSGRCAAHQLVTRVGKEFNQGRQSFHWMQTAALRSAARETCGDQGSREAYTTGLGAEWLFGNRAWSIEGSFVGSIIDSEPLAGEGAAAPPNGYGTGGQISVNRRGGKVRGGVWAGWESDRLELNDLGYLQAPDEIGTGLWLNHQYAPTGEGRLLHRGSFNLNLYQEYLYAPRAGYDLHDGREVWRYARGHRSVGSHNINGWVQWRNYCESWFGINANPEGTQRWDTRSLVQLQTGGQAPIPGGGPLIDEPWTWGAWWGASSDTRKGLVATIEGDYYDDEARNLSRRVSTSIRWSQSSAVHHSLSASYRSRIDDTQHLVNLENPGGGIGGVSFVYGDLRQEIFSLTLRTSLLFSRSQSLEVYAQPYLTVGDYRRARELARADSYDLALFEAEGFAVDDYDFSYASVNLNAVYRWEYRPGSTLYLVWTHGRATWDQRGFHSAPGGFENRMTPEALFRNEPENTLLVKVSYWLPV